MQIEEESKDPVMSEASIPQMLREDSANVIGNIEDIEVDQIDASGANGEQM